MLEFATALLSILACLVLSLEIGFRLGVRGKASHDTGAAPLVGAVQGAVLGLLGLILAFSFGGAATRFLDRQDLIVLESNALGTAWLRADLLPPENAAALRAALRRYTEHRLEVSSHLSFRPPTPAELSALEGFQSECWTAAVAGMERRPATAAVVAPAVNDVIDIHSLRMAAGRKRLPALVLGLLGGCSILAAAVLGLGCGLGGRRRLSMTVPVLVLIALTLAVTLDLDNPRAGTLQISDAPLEAVLRTMTPNSPPAASP